MKVIATLNLNPSCRFEQYRMSDRYDPYYPLAISTSFFELVCVCFIPLSKPKTASQAMNFKFCISCDRGGQLLQMRFEYLHSIRGWCILCILHM